MTDREIEKAQRVSATDAEMRMTRDCQLHTRGTAEPGYCEMLDCECYGDSPIEHCHDRTRAEIIILRSALQRALLTINVLVLDPQPGDREMAADTIRELCPVARLDPETLEDTP